jgi:hypothetical protein
MAVVTERPKEQPPYEAYAAITGVFVGGLALAGIAARVLDRNPAGQTPLDFVVLSAASFKAARTLARDEVTSFVRDPFVKGEAHEGGEDRSSPATTARRSASSSRAAAAAERGRRRFSLRRRFWHRDSAAC